MLVILNLSVSLRCRIWSWSNLRDLALGFRLLTLIVKGAIIILCWRIAISPEPNLRWTLEPVCKFKFVHCGPVDEKKLSIYPYLSIYPGLFVALQRNSRQLFSKKPKWDFKQF